MCLREGIKIRILALPGDPAENNYIGKVGIIENVSRELGETRLDGTWGGIGIYPNHDKIEIVD